MYPKDDEIRGKWRIYHKAFIILATLIIWPLFLIKRGISICGNILPFISVLGLYLDILGVIIASVESPHFGSFADGGDVEGKRTKIKEKYFKRGLILIGLGFLLQGIAVILK